MESAVVARRVALMAGNGAVCLLLASAITDMDVVVSEQAAVLGIGPAIGLSAAYLSLAAKNERTADSWERLSALLLASIIGSWILAWGFDIPTRFLDSSTIEEPR